MQKHKLCNLEVSTIVLGCISVIKFLIALAIICLGFQLSVQGQTNQEAMTPGIFREIATTPGDSIALSAATGRRSLFGRMP